MWNADLALCPPPPLCLARPQLESSFAEPGGETEVPWEQKHGGFMAVGRLATQGLLDHGMIRSMAGQATRLLDHHEPRIREEVGSPSTVSLPASPGTMKMPADRPHAQRERGSEGARSATCPALLAILDEASRRSISDLCCRQQGPRCHVAITISGHDKRARCGLRRDTRCPE